MRWMRAGAIALLSWVSISSCTGSSTNPLTPVSQSDPGLKKTPCRSRSATRNVYFGDLHVHTSYSFDAFGWGTRTDPVGAYAFAKGDSAILGTERGQPP